MNIQRKYSLPNCTLLLEGLSDAGKTAHYPEVRPELSILVNAECHISGHNQPLVGGREFFESLVRAVSGYAQEFLSNVSNPQAHSQDSELVEFQKIASNRHRLIVHSEITPDGFDSQPDHKKLAIQLDLNTVQLFDLVEAVDQFFADSQTLPELSLELRPVARGYGGANQLIRKEAVPAGIGVASLAVAAMAFSLIPAPELRPPEPKVEEKTSSTTPQSNSPTPKATTPPPVNVPTPTPETPPTVADLEALLSKTTEISNPSQLRVLNGKLYDQINRGWNTRSELTEDLVYRVGVTADGAIVGYKAVNQGANQGIELTPLPKLLYLPVNPSPIGNEPIAQFRVVFTKQAILQVSPWWGYRPLP